MGWALRRPLAEITRSPRSTVSGSARGTRRKLAEVDTPCLVAIMAMMLVIASCEARGMARIIQEHVSPWIYWGRARSCLEVPGMGYREEL